ncbi:hypothetical protein GH714_038475 [Hevea brasiliensis]|uniref:Ribonuclease H1 N-terminal domain-containing protein n=1 Tax=Hevea brasiliensis TaxID=3981 RepID=A0A6A6KLE5_HEVBR|nr:hypothetical protein GH714_038475 [Hevea brasiliensis]
MRVTSNRRKEKFYVVFHGLQPGIYTSWQECIPHVIGVSRSLYKSYDTMEEALHAFNHANNLPMNSYRGGDGMSLVASSGISTTLGNEEPCQQYLSTINMESKKSLMFGKEDPREESPSINVHENELICNCLNDLYYRVDNLVSQNHVNPSQWSFKFVCKNYDWKYKVDIPALEAVQFIGRDRTTIIVWKLPKPGRRLDHPMPFKLGYVCTEETSRRGKKPKLKARIAKGWVRFVRFYGLEKGDECTFIQSVMEKSSFFISVIRMGHHI